MAVGTYTLPICDLCKLPWLPVGWTQDSDPRAHKGKKPLRCGKCKSIGWDREHVKRQQEDDGSSSSGKTPGLGPGDAGSTPAEPTKIAATRTRCKHRMTNCPICHAKEAA